jgi:hypothetical protein
MCSKSNPLVVFALDLMSTYEGEHTIFKKINRQESFAFLCHFYDLYSKVFWSCPEHKIIHFLVSVQCILEKKIYSLPSRFRFTLLITLFRSSIFLLLFFDLVTWIKKATLKFSFIAIFLSILEMQVADFGNLEITL